MTSSSRSIDRMSVTFDEPSLAANAGLVLPMTLAVRLGIEALVNTCVLIRHRNGAGFRPGRKVLSVVATILAGGSHIDHAEALRAGATQKVLPFQVMAPSTLGTFLRAFTFGHIRQLDRVMAGLLSRAWALGAGPGDDDLVVDIDSTIEEVHGRQKQGAGYGYTGVLGYHPLLATRADTGEILHARLRKGQANTQRGIKRFTNELIARVRSAGAAGKLIMRFDSGFWSADTIGLLIGKGVSFTMGVRTATPAISELISTIDESSWQDIDYTDEGEAQVAECAYTTSRGRGSRRRHTLRLIVRRTRLIDEKQRRLWPDWRHFAFITDLDGNAVEVDQFHRDHATVELAIKDLKEGAGLEHCPSGKFFANAAWLGCGVIAHNLIRWMSRVGDNNKSNHRLTVMRTERVQLLSTPGRVVNRSGRMTLRLPQAWPWTERFTNLLINLRLLPAASG